MENAYWVHTPHQTEPYKKGVVLFRNAKAYDDILASADISELERDYFIFVLPPVEALIPLLIEDRKNYLLGDKHAG